MEKAGKTPTDEHIVALCRQHDPVAIIVRYGKVGEAAMAAAPSLRVVSKHGSGTDTIDKAAAAARGIQVVAAAGALEAPVRVLAVGREHRVGAARYDLLFPPAEPPVEGRLTFEVLERVGPDGVVVTPLASTEIDAVVFTSNKCIEGVPGFAFVLARLSALAARHGTIDALNRRYGTRYGGFGEVAPPQ